MASKQGKFIAVAGIPGRGQGRPPHQKILLGGAGLRARLETLPPPSTNPTPSGFLTCIVSALFFEHRG